MRHTHIYKGMVSDMIISAFDFGLYTKSLPKNVNYQLFQVTWSNILSPRLICNRRTICWLSKVRLCKNVSCRGLLPSQVSSQNLTWDSFFMWNVPNLRNSLLTFIRLAKKWESPLLHWTCTRGLVPRYLLHRICCHVPSIVISRYNHLLSKAMFLSSKFCIPSPPCYFGWHRISHFASRYFLLCPSLYQRNCDRK